MRKIINIQKYFMEGKENILSIRVLFEDDDFAINYAIYNKLIYQNMICDKCGSQMCLKHDKTKKLDYKWFCNNCVISRSLLYGSIFSDAKISIGKVFFLLYCWVYQYPCYLASHEVDVSLNTVSYYFTLFRNACDSYVVSCDDVHQIGGPNKTVQIDETLMCRRKYNVGRVLNQVWIFGGICVEDREFFCLVVKDRTKETLSEEIKKYILPGTTIISDCWKGYKYLDNSNEYTHLTVDHSKNFINPDNGANTQIIERLWRELKRINKKYEGIPRNKVNEHISEFSWRHNVLINANRKFQSAVELIADTQFLKISDIE